VGYLYANKPVASQNLIKALERKVRFCEAVNAAYGELLMSLWMTFLAANTLKARIEEEPVSSRIGTGQNSDRRGLETYNSKALCLGNDDTLPR
jgi:hypothetical protein